MATSLVCDFCCCVGSNPVVWDYPANSFTVVVHTPYAVLYTSNGHWGACSACHKFIEENNLDGLIEYSVQMFFQNEGIEKVPSEIVDIIRNSVKQLHVNFFLNRTSWARKVVS